MGKFLVRMTIICTTIYFLIAFYMAHFFGIDIINGYYVVLFELCVVVYCYSEDKYHCKFIKHLSMSIFVADLFSMIDNSLNFLSTSEHNATFLCCIVTGLEMTLYEAIKHFHDVSKLKQKRKKLYGNVAIDKL